MADRQKTTAERFIADPEAVAIDPPWNATKSTGDGDNGTVEFPDGSRAVCTNGEWTWFAK
jgi:hypothetical protein